VTVSSSTTDPNPANNSATIASLVTSVNGLSLSLDPTETNTTNGAAFAFNIRVANGGTAIDDVTVTDVLPAGLSLVSAKPTAGTCSGTSTLVCHTGTLNLGDLVTIRVVALPTHTGVLTNHVSASGGTQTAGADLRMTVVPTSRRRAAGH
jgi:uncharacterized repeat protein (TIGR01451 family)